MIIARLDFYFKTLYTSHCPMRLQYERHPIELLQRSGTIESALYCAMQQCVIAATLNGKCHKEVTHTHPPGGQLGPHALSSANAGVFHLLPPVYPDMLQLPGLA